MLTQLTPAQAVKHQRPRIPKPRMADPTRQRPQRPRSRRRRTTRQPHRPRQNVIDQLIGHIPIHRQRTATQRTHHLPLPLPHHENHLLTHLTVTHHTIQTPLSPTRSRNRNTVQPRQGHPLLVTPPSQQKRNRALRTLPLPLLPLHPRGTRIIPPPRRHQLLIPVDSRHQPRHPTRHLPNTSPRPRTAPRPGAQSISHHRRRTQQQMTPVDHLRTPDKSRTTTHRTGIRTLDQPTPKPRQEHLRHHQTRRPHPTPMPVQPPHPLQQQINRSHIAHQQIHIHIERLLRQLSRHHNQPTRPPLPHPRPRHPKQPQTPLRTLRTRPRRQPAMQQHHLPRPKHTGQRRVKRLRTRHRVTHDQRTTPALKLRPQQIHHRHIRLLLRLPLLHTRGPRPGHRLAADSQRNTQVGPPPLTRIHPHTRPLHRRPGTGHRRIPTRLRQRLQPQLLTRPGTRHIRLNQLTTLARRQRRRQQHHRHPGLTQPPQPLHQKLRHIHISSVNLVQDDDLPGQPRHPQHHMPTTSRRQQQLIDRPHHKRTQQATLGPQKPLRRPPSPRTLPHPPRLPTHPIHVPLAAELVHTRETELATHPLATLNEPPPLLVEHPLPVKQRHLRSQIIAPPQRLQPRTHLPEHRIARRLRRHAHEHPVSPETSSKNLRSHQRRLRLPLPHRRFHHQQPRPLHIPRRLHHQPLRGPGLHPEPLTERLRPRPRQRPPAAPQPQPRPRRPRPLPGTLHAHLRHVGKTGEMLFVTGDPVSHHDQPADMQLYRPRRYSHRLYLRQPFEPQVHGHALEQTGLSHLPVRTALQLPPALTRRLHRILLREHPVMTSSKRPHPRHMALRPAHPTKRPHQQIGARMLMPPAPLLVRHRWPMPPQPRRPHRPRPRLPLILECGRCLTKVVDSAKPRKQPAALTRTTGHLIQQAPRRRGKEAVPQPLSHSRRIKQVRQKKIRLPAGTLRRLPPQNP
ncbi:hypothetical protein GA0115250_14158 [Streptomyces sp. BvitLS-983]|nr:hypothetical protein GA0115250_14158 [Streptomyces sp. BvitLS-983]